MFLLKTRLVFIDIDKFSIAHISVYTAKPTTLLYLRLVNITCKDHVEVRSKICGAIWKHGDFHTIVKKRELRCFWKYCTSFWHAKVNSVTYINGTKRRGRQRAEKTV